MYRSPPSRRRGLKSDKVRAILGLDKVASFAEAWIEIRRSIWHGFKRIKVASFAEAWIEILTVLKVLYHLLHVASFAEAWIEILYLIQLGTIILRRLLRGGVD